MFRTKGAGLLEVMLALVIIIAIILVSLLQYQWQRWQKDLAVLQTSEAMLQQATLMYWTQNCVGITARDIPYEQVLAAAPGINPATIQNPWAINGVELFDIQLLSVPDAANGKNRWVFQITTTIDKPVNVVPAIAANLGAIASGNTISWTFTPIQYPNLTDVHLGLSNITYGYYSNYIVNLNPLPYQTCSEWVPN